MSFIFWGLTTTMIVAAVATVVTPIRIRGATSNMAIVIMAIAVSLFSIGLYSGIGSPDALTADKDRIGDTRVRTRSGSVGNSSKSLGTVASLIDGLRERLEKEPDDANGCVLLARSYEHLGRNQDAISAYGHAKALGKSDSGLEESLIAASLSHSEPAVASGPAVRGRIVLTPDAAALVEPEDTVFVFAKGDMNQAMPLAALRKSVADLPLDFELTDDMAMLPGSSLADFDKLVVVAQVSRSGRAKDVLGDLRVNSVPVSPLADDFVELRLDTGGPSE